MFEVSVNTVLVDEGLSEEDLEGKLRFFRGSKVKKNNVDYSQDLPLRMLDDLREPFVGSTRDAWVAASNYVHLTKRRIAEKVKLRAEGIRLGFETPQMLADVVQSFHDTCSIVIGLAIETTGPSVTGDILLTGCLDKMGNWPFHRNCFVAAIDAYFDYKHERKTHLESHIAKRSGRLDMPGS